jgi:hypothetical protein
MRVITLEEARAAKAMLRRQLLGLPELRGIGIAFLAQGCGLKVFLKKLPAGVTIPDEIDGVPIIVEIGEEPVPL